MNKKIKVCQVVSSDVTLKFMLLSQLKFLQSEGYEVHAVCNPGKWVLDIENEGIKVKTIRISRKILSPATDLKLLLHLFLFFRKERFHIVHVHTPKAEVYGQLAAFLAGVPIILNTLHGFGSDLPDTVPSWQKKLYLLLQKFSGTFSSTVLSISYDIIQKAKKYNIFRDSKLVYVGRDIDAERFNPQKYTSEFIEKKKKALALPSDRKIIGIVARLVAEKGLLELFEAFKKVLARFPDTLLLVIGPEEPEKKDGITQDTAKRYGIENNVMFLGERQDTEELYSLMDIFVLPSHREGLGAAILEASAMERPIIATNIGGIPEAVDNGKTGMLVPVKDVDSLAKATIFLLENPEKARQMGKEGRQKVIKEFSKKIVLERLGSNYEKLIKDKLNVQIEQEWLSKYSQAARENKEEYEIMFHSKTGFRNDNLYFFDYFKKHIGNKEHNENKKILDVGCGFGDSLSPLSKLGFQCYGVDYVLEIIEIAKQKNQNIEFQVADAYQLPFKDDFFDVVICKGVFQVLSDPERAMNELKRVLKKDGLVIIITLNIFSLDIFLQKNKIIRYNPYKFKNLLKKNGFDTFTLKGVYIMPSFLDFMADIMITCKIHRFLNLFYPLFTIFSHNFYLEARKK